MKLRSIETKKMEYLNNVVCQNINFLLDHYGIKYKDHSGSLVFACPIHGGDNTTALNFFLDGHTKIGNWVCYTHNCQNHFINTSIGFFRGVVSNKKFGWSKSGDRVIDFKYIISELCDILKIDLSIINSDGETNTSIIDNFFFEYSSDFKKELINIRKEVLQKDDLTLKKALINDLSRKITLLHVEAIHEFLKKNSSIKLDLIGYHGHTLIHKPEQSFTFQLGNPELMAQLLKTKVVFNFRDNDIQNKGQGAPLVTLYHGQILKNLNLINNGVIINIGGIANGSYFENSVIHSNDIGPGNCLLDQWIRLNSKDLEFDREGNISGKGEVNSLMEEDFLNHYNYHDKKKSLDITDFNIAQFRGLKLEDGAATLVSVTANLIANFVKNIKEKKDKIILAGGGRKNKTLIKFLSKLLNINVESIDQYKLAGDFIESQAFAYLAIRSLEQKHLSLPTTTGVSEPVTGGIVYSN